MFLMEGGERVRAGRRGKQNRGGGGVSGCVRVWGCGGGAWQGAVGPNGERDEAG